MRAYIHSIVSSEFANVPSVLCDSQSCLILMELFCIHCRETETVVRIK